MSDNVDGFQFDNVKISAENDAKLYNALANNRSYVIGNYEQGLSLSASGLNVTVGSGCAIVQGRMIYVKQEEILTLPANSTGYICLTIDLNEEVIPGDEFLPEDPNYTWTNNQVRLEYVSTLVEGNLIAGDKVVTFPLCSYTTTGTTATITRSIKSYVDKQAPLWSTAGIYLGATQTVYVPKHLDWCENGWLLEWQGFNNGAPTNGDYTYVHIPKLHGTLHNSRPITHIMRGFDGAIAKKVFYVNRETIRGVATNAQGDNVKMVLSAVYEY
ncbi:hypothetical protein ACJQ40_000174 [Enterococcus faecium]